jgi:hypothetical protein
MLFIETAALEFLTGSAGTAAVSGNLIFYYMIFPPEVIP